MYDEIIRVLRNWVDDRRDLKRLCEVSKNIYTYTVPRLYQAVTIRAGEESHAVGSGIPRRYVRFIGWLQDTKPKHMNNTTLKAVRDRRAVHWG